MTYIYKNKKTGAKRKEKFPLKGKEKEGWTLISWIKNIIIKSSDVNQK